MNELSWKHPLGPPVPQGRFEQVQASLGVILPATLRSIVGKGDGLRPVRGGQNASLLVDTAADRRPAASEGRVSRAGPVLTGSKSRPVGQFERLLDFADNSFGILHGHEVLVEHGQAHRVDLRWVVPIADNGGGFICLDYRQDPTRRSASVLSYFYPPVEEADPVGFHWIASDFDAALQMLQPEL